MLIWSDLAQSPLMAITVNDEVLSVHWVGPDPSPLSLSLCSSPTGLQLGTLSSQDLCIYWSPLLRCSFPRQPVVYSLTHDSDEIPPPPGGLPWPLYFKGNLPACLPTHSSIPPHSPPASLPPLTIIPHPLPTSFPPSHASLPSPTYIPTTTIQEEILSVSSPLYTMRAGTFASFSNHRGPIPCT